MSASKHAPGRLKLVQDFVNTHDREPLTEAISTPEALASWLAARKLLGPGARATVAEHRFAVELREALRALLRANTLKEPPPSAAAATLDAIAERAQVSLRFAPDGRSRLEPAAAGIDGALGRILAIVHEALADGSFARLKACHDQGCEWAFFDHTKNRSGTWCDMAVCGNRAKARAFRQRQDRRPSRG